MKRVISSVALVASVALTACCGGESVETISQDLKFCESVLAYGDGALIANFGSSQLNPLNNEGKGYINYYADGVMQRFIEADGTLSAPKGLLVCGDRLYVADVQKVVIYNLTDLTSKPKIVAFPEGDPYVNHLVQVGEKIFVTVTNSGNIYSIDMDGASAPELYTNIVGANGLLYANSELYIASYPADGVTTADNVIYKISDIANPTPQRVTERAGQYDGLALKGQDLYFTDWQGGVLGRLNLQSGAIEILNPDMPITGAAEIDIIGDKVAVPDLVNSVVYLFEI